VPFAYATDEKGFSAIHLLENLQIRINEIYKNLKHATSLLSNPPVLVSGYQVNSDLADEIRTAISTPGEAYIINGQQIKIDPYNPGLDVKTTLEERASLEQDGQKVLNMTSLLQGVPSAAVRSASYAQILSQFSAAPMKQVALRIEQQIEDIFNQLAEVYINGCPDRYTAHDRSTFLFSQLKPIKWGRIVIYANSTSPIIRDSNEQLLLGLAENGIIPKEILVKILDLPFKDKILQYISQKEQEAKLLAEAQSQEQSHDNSKRK